MFKFKYFKIYKDSTIDDIKKQYKKLAFKYHPDLGGSTEEMQDINNEYEEALKVLSTNTNKNYTYDIDFINIIDALIKLKMQDVTIEICGFFVWVSGNTKPYKNQLGKNGLGLIWHNKNIAWYWKPSWYYKKNKNSWNMDKIRDAYGSTIVNEKEERKTSYNPLPAY